MSMSTWDDNGAFNPSFDPMAFQNAGQQNNFDFAQMQNPQMQQAQLQQRMQNGTARNGSPAFQNPMYQTTPVVPSKRPHGDYMASPQQGSRSQTPQQPQPGQYQSFPGGVNGQQTPTPYQHLQHQPNSSNASPSPIMQNQNNFNPQGMPQRMSTASPSPFSPGTQSFGHQASPSQSEYGGRMETATNGAQPYMMGGPFGNGNNPTSQAFTPPPGSAPSGMMNRPPGSFPQNPQMGFDPNVRRMQQGGMNLMAQQQQQQQAQRMQQQSMNNMSAMAGASSNNPANNQNKQNRNPQFAQLIHAHVQQWMRQGAPDAFARQVLAFNQARGQSFNPAPMVAGRQMPAVSLYVNVMKSGGSSNLTRNNQWSRFAANMGLNPQQFPQAGQELEHYWRSNLSIYESHIVQSIQQQLVQNQQHQQQQRMAAAQTAGHPAMQNDSGANQEPFTPGRPPQGLQQDPAAAHGRRISNADFQTPAKPGMVQHQDGRHRVNGFRHPQQGPNQSQMAGIPTQGQLPPTQQHPPFPASAQTPTKPSPAPGAPQPAVQAKQPTPRKKPESNAPRQPSPMPEVFEPSNFQFFMYEGDGKSSETFAGLPVKGPILADLAQQLEVNMPDRMNWFDFGHIDIMALTMGLKSGMFGEVRLALDTLAIISGTDANQHLPLKHCGDLLEALVDCAEENLDILADNAAEVSDVMLISPYEDLIRGCKNETKTLQETPEYGSSEYDLDRAAERICCISRILRNWSCVNESNDQALSDPPVVRFLTTVIRYLGTRNMLLRNNRNTLEFEKDVLVFLSNNADRIDLSGKEEALCVLHFLLSFAPCPPPSVSDGEEIMFSQYQPALHRYLPLAVDALAKLFARGDPNRALYKSIFATDNASSPSSDLLTRAFGLAVAPLPSAHRLDPALVDTRIAFIAQGLLAAEILVSFIPTNDHDLARAWLTSQDGFAQTLFKLVTLFSIDYRHPPPPSRHPLAKGPVEADPKGYEMITNRGITVLRRLAERSKDSDKPFEGIPDNILPKQGLLLEVLNNVHVDPSIVRHLCSYAGLEP